MEDIVMQLSIVRFLLLLLPPVTYSSFGVYTDNRQLVRDEAGEAVLSTAEDTQSRVKRRERKRS